MSRQVYLENWQEQLEASIEALTGMTSVYSYTSEQDALLGELKQLKEMRRQVQEVAPPKREMVKSLVIALAVRESLQLPNDLVERLGELFDIYRRFHARLSWRV